MNGDWDFESFLGGVEMGCAGVVVFYTGGQDLTRTFFCTSLMHIVLSSFDCLLYLKMRKVLSSG